MNEKKLKTTRRTFLAQAGILTAGLTTGVNSVSCNRSHTNVGKTGNSSEIFRMPLLMSDDFEERNNVWWRVELAVPDPENPLLEGGMPWDAGGIGVHGTILCDPIDGLYKAWVIATPPEEQLSGIINTLNHRSRRLCYYESKDGIHWTRPELSDSSFGEHKFTNIIFNDEGGTQYASVNVNPDREWPYEMFVYRSMYANELPGYTKMYNYRSKDGKTWEEVYGPIKGPFNGDVAFIYPARDFDPDHKEGYVVYYRLGVEDMEAHNPGFENPISRIIFRAESHDGREWVHDRKIIARDERDHRDTQYMELVPKKVPGGYVGLVSVYQPLTQTQNLRLAVSRDGWQWWFPERRPCLDNPPLGDYGGGMIWQSKNLIEEGNRLYVYYGGMEGLHRNLFDTHGQEMGASYLQVGLETVFNSKVGFLPFNAAMCRASWRTDRLYALVSASGGPTVGMAVTRPINIAGGQLKINFFTKPPKKTPAPNFDKGYLQVELLDNNGNPVKGFARNDCPKLSGDYSAFPVKWTGGNIIPENASKVKFYLKRAFLYGFISDTVS